MNNDIPKDDTKKPELNEIATVEKDIYMDYIGRTLINPDKTLKTEGSGKGIELYEDLLRDPEIRQAMQTRRLAVVGREWEIIPGSDKSADIKIADYVKEVLLSCNFDNGRKALLSAIVLGFKTTEIMWEYSEGSIWINRFIGKPSRRFIFDLDNNLRLITMRNMIGGEAVPSRKFQVFAWGSDNGSPFGYGLGSSLYWMDWFAKNTLKFWMIFADKFGSPTAVGKYPNGTTTEQQGKLLSAIETIQTEAAIAIPDTMIIELLEAARQGSMDTYERLCNYLDKKKTKLILGQTLTSDVGDKGSYAASQTHNDVREEYIKADADELCQALNGQVIKWLVDYNFPNVKRYPKIWIRTDDEEDLKPLAERDQILLNMGARITHQYIHETYGIPEPQEGEELIIAQRQPAFPAFSEKNKKHQSGCSCGKHHDYSERDEWVDLYLERIAPALKNVNETALKNIEAWVRGLSEPPSEGIFISKMQNILGSAYEGIDKTAIKSTVTEIYTFFKLTDLIAPGLDVAFGGADIQTINFLSEIDSFYLSKFIKNSGPAAKFNEFLRDYYHEGGAGIFGRGDEYILELKNRMSQIMVDLTEGQVSTIVDTAVQRARNWGHISQMNDGGIAEIEIYEPTEECEFCQSMNGAVISVPQAYQMMQTQANMKPDEYEAFLKNKQNQPSLDNIASFVARGKLPPYHPHCHGTIITRVSQ
ncbi:MAG: DUF935 family protein [Nitrospirae bacterium]|nr:DUF935 family protein [Nitrospirota bacterium]